MIDRISPASEEELHAFIDGQLPIERRADVAAWLAENPEQAAMVAAWRAQAEGIRARYGAVADEPVPERLQIENVLRLTGKVSRKWLAMAAVAATLTFVVGSSVGWFARGASAAAPATQTDFNVLARDAIHAHKLYVVEVTHPVEVPATQLAHMQRWLTKRVGYEQRIPDLQSIGLRLVGGRLLPGATGYAAAFYMYENAAGERFTVYCAKADLPDSSLQFRQGRGQFSAVLWADDEVAYVVTGESDREKLEDVSKAIYNQIEKFGTNKS